MEEIMEQLNYQPVEVPLNEFEDPLKAMSDFFNSFPLHEARAKLWEFYKGWTYHSAEYVDTEEVRNMIYFYTQMVHFLNISYVQVEKEKLMEID